MNAVCVTISKTLGSGEPRYEPAALAQAYFDLTRLPETDWQAELVY